jgi:creatinine amidohydrolase
MNLAELTWPEIAALVPHTPVVVPIAAMEHDLVQSAVDHACEWETSMMLAIRPDLVKPFQSLENRDMGYSFEPAYRGWITQERRPNAADAPGRLGDPRHASAEKGEYLFTQYAAGAEAFLHKVIAWDGHSWEFSPRP